MFEFSAFGSILTIDSLTLAGVCLVIIAISAIRYLCRTSGDCHCRKL